MLAAALGTLLWLKQVGIGDKYVQQRDDDQERAFQLAFTLELLLSGVFFVLVARRRAADGAGLRRAAAARARASSCSLAIVGAALQTPIWPYYRSMDFLRQRHAAGRRPARRVRRDGRAGGRRARATGRS